jgi:heptaprenyl diphosphate synthase
VTSEHVAEYGERLRLREVDPALADAVNDGLVKVEEELRSAVRSKVDLLAATATHLVEAGGKRFRPLFTLLAAQFGDGRRQDVITAATAVELIHLATLYHDDVVDDATMRRGAVSVNARWDNTVAILTGDFLFAQASRLVSGLGTDAARIIAETFAELVSGEMREITGPADGEDVVEHYLSVIGQKTGSLIATSGRYGGMCSGVDEEYVGALCRYGELIGTAFQISDDIIDIASPSTDSGKIPGTDLREGVHTLPVLYALADADGNPRLAELLAGPVDTDERVAEALELLRGSSGMARAGETLADYAARARAELDNLPACSAREALGLLTEYVVARTR